MSSHHFVREGQEPALILLDPFNFEKNGSLLEWAPLIIATENCIDEILSLSVKIDVVIGRDPALLANLVEHQAPVKVIESLDDHLGVALYFLLSVKQYNVVIAADHPPDLLGRLAEFHDRINISVISAEEKWSFIRSKKFSKWLAEGMTLRFIAEAPLYINDRHTQINQVDGADAVVELRSEQGFWIIEKV